MIKKEAMKMNNYRYKESYWFTFGEVMTEVSYETLPYLNEVLNKDNNFASFVNQYNVNCESGETINQELLPNIFQPNAIYTYVDKSQYITDVWNLIIARYFDHYCVEASEYDSASGLQTSLIREFIVKLLNIFNMTTEKYSVLLGFYASKKADLMNKIQSTSSGSAKFNDTPQNYGEFSDDDHMTNITKTEGSSSTDGDTLMERLNEIQNKYRKILQDWSNEFEKIFVEEGNVQ